MGVNDTSALVNFYGLNAGETYNAVLIKSTGTTASNIDQTVNTSWGGLQATDATHAYDLSAEAGTASNNGKFVGTGYNDTSLPPQVLTLTTAPAAGCTAPAPERGWQTAAWTWLISASRRWA